MVNHGVPCCFGARNIITTAMMNYCNVWCLKSLVPLGSEMKKDVLDEQKPIQRLSTSIAVCHWDCQPKQRQIMICLIRWSRCAIGENQLQGLLQGPTLRHCAMLFWVKTEDMQGLKRFGVMALSMGTYMDGWKSVGNQLFFLEIIRYING